ncbi:MAG: hypothetical protein AAF127_06690 [Pseudomonadota bacterium]
MIKIKTALGIASLTMVPFSANAGVIADIKISREVPDMVAEVDWSEPEISEGQSLGAKLEAKSVLWETSVTFTQRAAKLAERTTVDGSMAAVLPEGSLFTGWRLTNGTHAMCNFTAEDPAKPGKARFAVCETSDGVLSVRKGSKRMDQAVPGSATAPLALEPGFTQQDNVRGIAWRGPVLHFSYRQSGERSALLRRPTSASKIQLVAQLKMGLRLRVDQLKGRRATISLRRFDLGDYTVSLEKRKNTGYAKEKAEVDLSSGQAIVQLGDAEFKLTRQADGTVDVETIRAPEFTWEIDERSGRLILEGGPYTIGAQER